LEGPLEDVRHHLTDLQQAAASVARIDELFRLEPVPREHAVEKRPLARLRDGPLVVRFEQVTFAYGDDLRTQDGNGLSQRKVLNDISFELAPGRILGLLGRTGSGKTTLSRLVFRLHDPDSGRITLGGHDLRDLAASDLRRRVGLVTQDVQIFHASLRENITLFRPDVRDADILNTLRELGLWEWYAAQPKGLDTQMAAGGATLSAGEAQLVALVRVFLRDPGLVILDEASSRLDPATERLLTQAIDDLLRDRTAIVIAHRLATVRRADEILILENGRIAEHGAARALAADPDSRYHGLLDRGRSADSAEAFA
jgi:ATP-binding cassette, subfamily B, bacterial